MSRSISLCYCVFVSLELAGLVSGQCELTKLSASDPSTNTFFGAYVSVSGDVLVAASDRNGLGSVDVFRYDGRRWTEEQTLIASDPGIGGPRPVSLHGNVIVVGAWNEDNAYVYRHDGQLWVEEQKLTSNVSGDFFGWSVSVFEDIAVVGAFGDGHAGSLSGAAYVFRCNGHIWAEEQKLTASAGGEDHQFGRAVAVSESVVVVGAIAAEETGAAYVYRYDGAAWLEEQELIARDRESGDWFGYSLSVSADVIVVGALFADDDLGAAYVYRDDGDVWVEEQKLAPEISPQPFDMYGYTVSVSNEAIAVGAPGDDQAGGDSGAVYFYRNNGDLWAEEQKLTSSDAEESDQFGVCDLDGNIAAVGSSGDDEIFEDSGSVYVYAVGGPDCNDNGQADLCDIAIGSSKDLDANFIPDDCEEFLRGDADGSGSVSGIADGVFVLSFGFIPGSPIPPCMDAADADDSNSVLALVDAIYVLNFQFVPGSPPPPSPGADFCGSDPTKDPLMCESPLCP